MATPVQEARKLLKEADALTPKSTLMVKDLLSAALSVTKSSNKRPKLIGALKEWTKDLQHRRSRRLYENEMLRRMKAHAQKLKEQREEAKRLRNKKIRAKVRAAAAFILQHKEECRKWRIVRDGHLRPHGLRSAQ